MMVKLNTTLTGVTWVLTVYMLILTILAPACRLLADRYGRKQLYVMGIVVFTIGSLLCGRTVLRENKEGMTPVRDRTPQGAGRSS